MKYELQEGWGRVKDKHFFQH